MPIPNLDGETVFQYFWADPTTRVLECSSEVLYCFCHLAYPKPGVELILQAVEHLAEGHVVVTHVVAIHVVHAHLMAQRLVERRPAAERRKLKENYFLYVQVLKMETLPKFGLENVLVLMEE